MKAAELYRQLSSEFSLAGIDSPELTARLIIEHVTGISPGSLISNPEQQVPDEQSARIVNLAQRRLRGEPVFRIIGSREFFGLPFNLNPHALEPRPDTETLVETAIGLGQDIVTRKGQCRVLDLGTGTGAIGISIASKIPEAKVTLSDVEPEAVRIARQNAELNGLAGQIEIVVSDWYENIDSKFDLIVSNPPYVETAAIDDLAIEVRDHDPHLALDGGEDGLDCYRAIARGAGEHLDDGGLIVLEIGQGQRPAVTGIFNLSDFSFRSARCDLAGIERVLVFSG